MMTLIEFDSPAGEALVDISEQVRTAVAESGVEAGICVVIAPHTTAGVTLNSGLDPATPADLVSEFKRLVPKRVDFVHQYDTPADAAGHIKAALVGQSVTLAIDGGELLLGWSQSVMFFEFDGPRKRQAQVKIIAG